MEWTPTPRLSLSVSAALLNARFDTAFVTCGPAPCTTPSLLVAQGNRLPGVPEKTLYTQLRYRLGHTDLTADWRLQSALARLGPAYVAPKAELLDLPGLQALKLGQGASETLAELAGKGDLLIKHVRVHFLDRHGQGLLHGAADGIQGIGVAPVGQAAGAQTCAGGESVERFECEWPATNAVRHLPFHQHGLAFAVGHHAHEDEGLLVRLELAALQ